MDEVTSGALAPADTPVAAPVATPAPDTTAVPGAQEEKPEPQPEEKMLPQSEVDRIVAREKAKEARRTEKFTAERVRREIAEQEAARLRDQLAGKPPANEPKGKPKASDYQNPEDWMDALADYKIEQREAKRREESQRTANESAARVSDQKRAQFVQEKIFAPGREKFEDFDDVVLGENTPITDPMVAAASKFDNAADVLYHLASNRSELERISRLDDIDQVWEVKDLAAKLKASPTPTKTPPPIVPSGQKATVDKDPSKMSDKEFAEWRKRQIAQRR
jgi:hypothetical protein